MRTKEEIQSELKSVTEQISKLTERKHELESEYDEVMINCFPLKLQVGDNVITSSMEHGEVISVNGPAAFPYIVLIHRNDKYNDESALFNTNGTDDVAMFGTNGELYGDCKTYTIEKI